MKLNQKGFSPVHILLMLVIVGLVGFTGWYVYNAGKETDKTLTSSASDAKFAKKKTETTKTDVYAGWKGATVTEKVGSSSYSIKHPSDWIVRVAADEKDDFGGGKFYAIELKSPSGKLKLMLSNSGVPQLSRVCTTATGGSRECTSIWTENLKTTKETDYTVAKRVYKFVSYNPDTQKMDYDHIQYVPSLIVFNKANDNDSVNMDGTTEKGAAGFYLMASPSEIAKDSEADAKAFFDTEEAKTAIQIMQSIFKS